MPCLKHREGYSLFAAQEATRNFVGHAGQFIGHEVAASSVDHVVNELFNNTVSGLGERWVIKRHRERLLRPPRLRVAETQIRQFDGRRMALVLRGRAP